MLMKVKLNFVGEAKEVPTFISFYVYMRNKASVSSQA